MFLGSSFVKIFTMLIEFKDIFFIRNSSLIKLTIYKLCTVMHIDQIEKDHKCALF